MIDGERQTDREIDEERERQTETKTKRDRQTVRLRRKVIHN